MAPKGQPDSFVFFHSDETETFFYLPFHLNPNIFAFCAWNVPLHGSTKNPT